MFQMNKAQSEHIWPLNGDGINNSQRKKSEGRRDESNEGVLAQMKQSIGIKGQRKELGTLHCLFFFQML
ncbi:hypothetical protein MLD38_013804 [Melastoma candidum]|uniref:Uncharacterized protein n=1 Tax=Melastoma candidum TaxID=119954 RepID=A0ACB9RAE2_9MYRT|nr:hypothetical protein MLD38_013804 [Melastoma candidum]